MMPDETINRHPAEVDGPQILTHQNCLCRVVLLCIGGLQEVCKDTPSNVADIPCPFP